MATSDTHSRVSLGGLDVILVRGRDGSVEFIETTPPFKSRKLDREEFLAALEGVVRRGHGKSNYGQIIAEFKRRRP